MGLGIVVLLDLGEIVTPAKQRYPVVKAQGNPRARALSLVYAHLLVAERALGRPVPLTAEVHHVDDDKTNNAPSNLVICEDRKYHQLLHVRTRVVKRGGNPNTHRLCTDCRLLKPFAAFNRAKRDKAVGLQSKCRQCQSSYAKRYFERQKLLLR